MENKSKTEKALLFAGHHSHRFSNWDFLVIGKGEKRNGAITVFEIEGTHSISENDIQYWISGLDKHCGMTIYKNTKEGKELTKMIKDKVGLEKIEEYLTTLTASNIGPKKLVEWIQSMNKTWYEKGREDKAEEIRNVLGV